MLNQFIKSVKRDFDDDPVSVILFALLAGVNTFLAVGYILHLIGVIS